MRRIVLRFRQIISVIGSAFLTWQYGLTAEIDGGRAYTETGPITTQSRAAMPDAQVRRATRCLRRAPTPVLGAE